MKKRLISILCILTFIITTFVQPVMAYDFDIISFEELRVAMVDKFAEYGIAFEIKQTEPNAIFTQKQLSEELKKIDIYGQKYVEYCKAQEKNILQKVPLKDSINILRSPAYGYTTGSSDSWLKQPDLFISGSCKIRTSARFYCDFQYNNILTAYKPTLEVREAIGFYEDYVKLIDYKVYIDNSSTNFSKHKATYIMTIELKQEYNTPNGTIGWAKVEHQHMEVILPFR